MIKLNNMKFARLSIFLIVIGLALIVLPLMFPAVASVPFGAGTLMVSNIGILLLILGIVAFLAKL